MNEVYEVYGNQKLLYFANSNMITTMTSTNTSDDHIIFFIYQ